MSEDYRPPTAPEVRALLAALGLTGAEAARLTGLAGSRQIRKYTGGEAPRQMGFPILYTLLNRAAGRVVHPPTWREEVADLLRMV